MVDPPRSLCPPDPLGTQLCVSIATGGRHTSSFPHRSCPMGVASYEAVIMRAEKVLSGREEKGQPIR
jgi:hypothetical protein